MTALDKKMVEFSEQSTSWESILEPMIGIVVVSEVHNLVYVVLSKKKKHVH